MAELGRMSRPPFVFTLCVRPSSDRPKLKNNEGTIRLRSSPLNPNHGYIEGCRRTAGPPRLHRSHRLPARAFRVPPACTHQLFWRFMCQFVFTPVSVIKPCVVQKFHSLKFIWRLRYTFVGFLNCSA